MLDRSFETMDLKDRLSAQIASLKEIAHQYSNLARVNYGYQQKAQTLEAQIHALVDLRDGQIDNDINWHRCYQRDLNAYFEK